MSRVLIRSANVLGGASGGANFSYFADSFSRADQPFEVGTNWICTLTVNENFSLTGVQLAGLWNIGGGTELVLANAGGPAPCPSLLCFPARINPGPLWGKSQFCEIKVISGSNNTNTFSIGPAVFVDQNGGNGYIIEVNNNGAAIRYRLDRWVNGNTVTVIIAFRNINYGDTIRLEVIPGSPHTLNVYLNGVLDATVTDAGVAAAGVPALAGSCINGSNVHIQNYKGGSLPQVRTDANFFQ